MIMLSISIDKHKCDVMYLEYDGLGTKVDILIAMLHNGPMNRGAFVKYTSYDSAIKILRRFESVGLTEWKELGDRRDTVMWNLTPKGEKVAKMLEEVEQCIEEK
jgi:predicted transcriptional regulator